MQVGQETDREREKHVKVDDQMESELLGASESEDLSNERYFAIIVYEL